MSYDEIVKARICAELKKKLEEIARQRELSLSGVIRLAISEFVERESDKVDSDSIWTMTSTV